MSNSLDLDQARRFVGPDHGPNRLQRLSAEDTSKLRVKHCCKQIVQWENFVNCIELGVLKRLITEAATN